MKQETQDIFPKDPKKTYGLMALVRRTSTMVDKGPDDTVMSWPRLLILEILATLGTTAVLLFWSMAASAPLREIANPDVTENPAKAAWYFLSLQELLLHMSPVLAGLVIPVLMLVALMAIPYIDRSTKDVGIWFASPKGRKIAVFSTFYTTVCLVGLILFDEYVRVRSLVSTPEVVPAWIVPVVVIGGLTFLLYRLLRRWRPNRREIMIGLFTGFVVSYVVTTIVGIFFRGFGMHLTWPWELPPGALPF